MCILNFSSTVIQLDTEVVVVGGGMAGICAAISAARNNANVIFIQDRPVLGGNQSSEMQVGISGADCSGGANARYVRETGIIEELMIEHMHRTPVYATGFHKQDILFWEKVNAEPNIRLLLNTSAVGVMMNDDGSIAAVEAVNTTSEKEYRITGKIFIDATGDGSIAARAGADFRMGREAACEFHEKMAPETADSGTMGSSIFFNARMMDHEVPFTPPAWAYDFPNDEDLPFRDMTLDTLGDEKQFTGFWWLEYGGIRDTISDNEEIRDELYKIVFGIWDHMKNHGEHGCRNYDIVWMNVLPAKRESRRIIGDYIVHENDVRQQTLFEDRVAYGGWPIDIHPPEGIYSKEPPCTGVSLDDIWNIPFRSLYSRNIPNLMMAGRNISVTHVALGSARVMATCALMGQAVGTAAHLCIRHNILPRDIVASGHIEELQQTLLRDDCYIKDLKNQDKKDLARTASICVSSEEPLRMPEDGMPFRLDTATAQMIPVSGGKIDTVKLLLQAEEDLTATLRIVRSSRINAYPQNGIPVCTAAASVSSGEAAWVSFDIHIDTQEDALFWLVLEADPRLCWMHNRDTAPIGTRIAVYDSRQEKWRNHPGALALEITPVSFPFSGKNVINGVSRPAEWSNIWISDSTQNMPQELTLCFAAPTVINTVQLTFDTDLNKNIYLPAPWGTVGEGDRFSCVKEYDVLVLSEDAWVTVAQRRGNYQRHCIEHFNAITAQKVAVRILTTNGDPSAKIYEIRCYNENRP